MGSPCDLESLQGLGGLRNSLTLPLPALLRAPWQMRHRKKKMKRTTNFLNRKSVVLQITNL